MPKRKYKKRADGRYLSQITIGYQQNGKPLIKNVYARTVPELESKLAVVRRQIDTNTIIINDNMLFEEWAQKWLDVYKTGISENTRKMYKTAIYTYILPKIGKCRLKDLRAFNFQSVVSAITDEKKYRTAEIVALTLNQIMEKAKENHYVYENPASRLFTVKVPRQIKRPLTDEEERLVFSADLTLKERAFLLVLLYTGVRRGEALALTKGDIDLNKRTLTVSKTIVFAGNAPILKPTPKTDAGNREIPIPDLALPDIEKYIRNTKSIYLFPGTVSGGAMSASSYRRFWERVVKKVNEGANCPRKACLIANFTPHLLRHTYATMLYYAGVDIKTAGYYLGHSSTAMTMDIYTHLKNTNNTDTVGKINNYLSSNKIFIQSPPQSERQ